MNPISLFSSKTIPEPRSWSLGNCTHCEQLQPIRISDHIKVFSFALLPLSRKIVGQSCCCDFCLHEMRVGRGLRETDLANWLPGEGTRRLFEVLQYSAKSGPDLPPSLSDTALRALLESADEKSSSKQLDVSAGIVAGVLLGLFFGTVAAFVGYQLDIRWFDLDAIGTAICLALASLCIGLILGPLVHAIMLRRKIPRRILERAVKDYGVDPRRIQELAAGHSRRTQAAARALD